MDKLIKAREIINEIDREIAALFEKRMEAVREVAEYKIKNGHPVYDPERENEVIKNNLSFIESDDIRQLYVPFINSTMGISKQFQRQIMNSLRRQIDTVTVNLSGNSYDIIFQRGALKKAGELLGIPEGRKVLIVTDSGVPEEYVNTVVESFTESHIFVFPEGEQSKNFQTYMNICQTLCDNAFTRKDAVIAVGGGVSGDMAGFAAATYMRGIDFYNIPTTLLSQVDSSIGGKTAIDLGKIKNIIGAFHQPKKVIIDPDVLSTLPDRHIKNGLAEALKAGIIFDKELFGIFLDGKAEEKIDEVLMRSLAVKKYIVEQDEKETGLRKVLNFGHTVGHAIEASVPFGELYHGECVAIGMVPFCGAEIKEKVVSALHKIGLPSSYPFDREKVREIIIHDKKSSGTKISVVKCDEIGSFYFEEMTADEIMNLI